MLNTYREMASLGTSNNKIQKSNKFQIIKKSNDRMIKLMEKRDYIMEQIKQFGRVLGMILAGILRLKESGKSSEIHSYVENEMKDHLNLNFLNMAELTDNQFIDMMIHEKKLSFEGIETFAEIFIELGEIQESESLRQKYLTRALFIYEFLTENSETYSITWSNKINRINELLNPDI
jgi:hypothetical protein